MNIKDLTLEIQALNTIRCFLVNGGNDYSSIGRERNMMEECDVRDTLEKLDKEINLLISMARKTKNG